MTLFRSRGKKPILTTREILALLLTALFLVTALLFYIHESPANAAGSTLVSTQKEDSGEEEEPDAQVDAPGMLPGEALDLNTATPGDLTRLPGIGESRAEAIVSWRESNGGFQTVEQLQEVYGIGPKTLERLAPYITVTPIQAEND